MTAPRLKTCTLGCKVNQYETEYVRQGLLASDTKMPLRPSRPTCVLSTRAR